MKKIIVSLVFAILISGLVFQKKATAQVNTQDSLALIALFNSTNGGSWTISWDTTQPISTWLGITILQGRITALSLYNNNLTGTLPPEIGNLDSLKQLILYDNNLYGSLPPEIGNLFNLRELRLENNSFSGSLPFEIGNLVRLYRLQIASNQFSGTVPNTIGNLIYLQELALGSNQFSGAIPSSIGNLVNLSGLYLNNNFFTSLPSSMSQLSYHNIFLSNNPFLDSLPENMFVNYPTIGLGIILLDNCNFNNLPNPFPSAAISLKINNNRLTFGDIEPILTVTHQYNILNISPQDSIYSSIDTTIHFGDTVIFNSLSDGQNNNYIWRKNGIIINPYYNPTFTITNATISDQGVYTCEIWNSVVNQLSLFRRPITLRIDTTTKMNLLFNDLNNCLIFPNPNNGKFTVTESDNIKLLEVFNLLGETIYYNIPNKYQTTSEIDLTNFPKGIYFVKVDNSKQVLIEKVVLN